jgi:hypothetical protein
MIGAVLEISDSKPVGYPDAIRTFWYVTMVLILFSAITNAQGNCNCVCKQGTQKCVSSFKEQCPVTCSISACGSAEQLDTLKSKWSAGACRVIITPGDLESLATHERWSIGHQGARVGAGPNNDDLIKGENLRVALVVPPKLRCSALFDWGAGYLPTRAREYRRLGACHNGCHREL